jgi:hypothetical protein
MTSHDVISLTGYLLLWNSNRGLFRVPETGDLVVAVFSTRDRLRAFVEGLQLEVSEPKVVQDGDAFLATVAPHLRVVIDPDPSFQLA